MAFITEVVSPIGTLTLAGEGESLTGLWIEDQKYYMAGMEPSPVRRDEAAVFDQARRWLDRYFAGDWPQPGELPLQPGGTVFQKTVWDILRRIPRGETTTYGVIAREIAAQTGKNVSAQAVGNAVGRNPISIIIPCHRVVGADGSLTGYAGGIRKKQWLLDWEGVDVSRLKVPRHGTAL